MIILNILTTLMYNNGHNIALYIEYLALLVRNMHLISVMKSPFVIHYFAD